MPILNIFLIVGVIALIFSFSKGRNAIWGGATYGLIIGIVIGVFTSDFSNIIRVALLGADVGLLFTILPVVLKLFPQK